MSHLPTGLAWAAGFVDGEGCIALIHHKQQIKGVWYESFVLRLSVANTDLRSLHRLQEMFGGSIHSARRPLRVTHKPCWNWYCQSAKAETALTALLPYLFTKKEQAELGLLARQHLRRDGRQRTSEQRAALVIAFDRLKEMKRA